MNANVNGEHDPANPRVREPFSMNVPIDDEVHAKSRVQEPISMKVNPFDEEVQGALHFIDAVMTQVMKWSSIIKLCTSRMAFC